MAYLKVLVIKMLLPNNKIVKRGDVFDESLIQNAKELEEMGYVSKATKKDIDAFKNKDAAPVKPEEKAKPETKVEAEEKRSASEAKEEL